MALARRGIGKGRITALACGTLGGAAEPIDAKIALAHFIGGAFIAIGVFGDARVVETKETTQAIGFFLACFRIGQAYAVDACFIGGAFLLL
ncbi:MAG: hypothetical protein VYA34_00970 [Myxococcota bacterium]|nr:hypothetical protein [Myxococcota bacterium]